MDLRSLWAASGKEGGTPNKNPAHSGVASGTAGGHRPDYRHAAILIMVSVTIAIAAVGIGTYAHNQRQASIPRMQCARLTEYECVSALIRENGSIMVNVTNTGASALSIGSAGCNTDLANTPQERVNIAIGPGSTASFPLQCYNDIAPLSSINVLSSYILLNTSILPGVSLTAAEKLYNVINGTEHTVFTTVSTVPTTTTSTFPSASTTPTISTTTVPTTPEVGGGFGGGGFGGGGAAATTTPSTTVSITTMATTTIAEVVSTSFSALTQSNSAYVPGTWTNGNYVTVALACSATSGTCNATYYCTDTANACPPSVKYSSPVKVSTAGISYIRYYSTDNVGHSGSVKSNTIKIDSNIPITAATAVTASGGAYAFGTHQNTSYVSVSLSCSESPSGCNATYYCTDTSSTCTPTYRYSVPVVVSLNGTSYIRYYSTDNAGTSGAVKGNIIDLTVPQASQFGGKWVSAYYAAWQQEANNPAPNSIDYSAVSLIVHFNINPYANGSLDLFNGFNNPNVSYAAISAAHAHGKKIVITVGGAYDGALYDAAMSPSNVSAFVTNLVNFMTARGYDGIDLDIEPIENATRFQTFVPMLANAMKAANPSAILTIAYDGNYSYAVPVQQYFQQINIMSYDMSGAFPGWVTWFNSPIYSGGCIFKSTLRPVPSINQSVSQAIAAGINKSKIGIGIEFYGAVWKGGIGVPNGTGTSSSPGVYGPCQSWNLSSSSYYPAVSEDVAYSTLAKEFASYPVYWDSAARESYISVVNKTNQANNEFVSFDNPLAVAAKALFIKQRGIGGVILYELGGGYISSNGTEPLLEAVKQAFANGIIPNSTTFYVTRAPQIPDNTTKVSISARATNLYGIANMSIYVDNSITATCKAASACNVTAGPFVPNTIHTYYVSAIGNPPGNVPNATQTYTFNVIPRDTTPPTVSFVYPSNGMTVSNTVVVNVSSTDSGTGVASVKLYIGNTLLGTATTAPYRFPLNTWLYGNGAKTLTAYSTDYANNVASNGIAINIQNPILSTAWVYAGSLNANWSDLSYGGTANFSSTNPVYNHTHSVAFTPSAQWGALSMYTPNQINDSAGYNGISFYINGGSTNETITVLLEGPSTGYKGVAAGTTSGSWQHFFVPMSSLDPGYVPFDRIDFISSGLAGNRFYVDDIALRPR